MENVENRVATEMFQMFNSTLSQWVEFTLKNNSNV